ncbi:MAG: biopolymer transporter ExbD [Leptolyngbyaceae cyanobacterium SM1_3_5]|nr:biopolymer transporter ExbD [Leptolyngbyaceae cyanobacterium SM1_3_5]
MRLPEEPDTPAQINIVPMIDVIFALLTFFILSTLFLTRSEGLPVNLPTANSTQTNQQSQIVVTLNPQGEIFINRQPTALNELAVQVRTLAQTNPNALVVINADAAVPHGQVVAAMDQVRSIPGVRLAIATQRP